MEDNRRIGAVSVGADGTIWTGFTNGSLVQWDGSGTRLLEVQYHVSSVQCICSFADRLWIGYASGTIQLIDLLGNLMGEWVGHSCPVIAMAIAGSYLFSLAHHGGIRGWHLTSPGPVDDILRNELARRELAYTKMEEIKILAGTWNVGQEKAGPDSLISWLGSAVSDVGLVVVGLQEVEMGAGFLAMSAAKESVSVTFLFALVSCALGEYGNTLFSEGKKEEVIIVYPCAFQIGNLPWLPNIFINLMWNHDVGFYVYNSYGLQTNCHRREYVSISID